MQYTSHYRSPIGDLTLAADEQGLTGLWFDGQKYFGSTLTPLHQDKPLPLFEEVEHWLDLYFDGKQPKGVPPLHLEGTPFRLSVWQLLLEIPYGELRTYKQLAEELARRQGLRTMSAQAIGGAVGHNPISLIVPCHRIVGSDGSLTGYAGGMERKEWLLRMERK
ncbi:MAG: methylated-DNA--[protein]-cysteine S-methyltransferase [Mediterranea sp.]|jgi:methylated-DNA-[protein]-cysteine S-methyltransferase|nr:methylated-DNA--[protein]-cysteine S-methyltransferase [Mediterranea sp.]